MSEAAATDEALLDVQDVHAGYGGSEVLHGVDLRIGRGEAVALLGRNGMGKTTLVRTIAGLHRASAGRIAFAGAAVEREAPYRIARRGLGLVPEGRQVFANLTVHEHLSAFERPAAQGSASNARIRIERVYTLFPRLNERRTHLGNQLSGGEQQML
ncbi:MAG TPA: ATP-binding cassette domain-containing protein, partial [Caldimonas sp.]|nr:ATP-binding cassette domain-containing protein [Caldimonas sp.]